MQPAVVVDVGNTRIKWGRCLDAFSGTPDPPPPGGRQGGRGKISQTASLPPDEPEAWERQLEHWGLNGAHAWAVSGVHPQRRDRLIAWLRGRGNTAVMVDDAAVLPLKVALANPGGVGVDRLLAAVAANTMRASGRPAVIVDAGSAVTVDWLDELGTFRGGAIYPGFRLMAEALHEHTALLPLVEIRQSQPPMPGATTIAAMEAGIFWAVAGGIRALFDRLAESAAASPQLFLTGGDADLLEPALGRPVLLRPEMTLEGVRLTAETLP